MSVNSHRNIRFRAMGAADLKGPEGTDPRSVLARPKLVGLLSFLAAAPKGFQRRDTITGLFWGELSQERARGALRQSLYYLRQFLGEGVIVTRGDDEIALDWGQCWCDVAEFEELLDRGAREEALELYRGDLLQGFFVSGALEFERWLDQRRDELRERARVAAWELAQAAESMRNATDAARWARQALKLAPLDEDMVRQVIELLARLGDRSGAVREYEAFAARLAGELELEPVPETKALIESVRSSVEVGAGEAAGLPRLESESESSDWREEKTAVPGAGPAAEPTARFLGTRAFRFGLVAGAALFIGLGIIWAFNSRDVNEGLDSGRVVVAVFENHTGDPNLDLLGHMAADWVTEGLGQIAVVEVVPSASGLEARPDLVGTRDSGPIGIRALAEATHAGTVVAGAYYQSADTLQFQAQIVDARNGELLSAVPAVSGPIDSPVAVVDSLRRRVVGTVARVFDSRLADPSAGSDPPSLEAYREYLEGRAAFYRVPLQMLQALTFFQRAVALDSTFLEPRVFIVLAHINLGEYQAADSNARFLIPHRPRMTEEQRHTLDYLLAVIRGDRRAALEAARAMGGLDVGVEAFRSNRPREAVEVLAGRVDIAESYYKWLTLLEAYHALGDYRRELREAERGRGVDPDRMRALNAELRALAALGRIDAVMQRLDESLLLAPEDGLTQGRVMRNVAAELRAHGFREASFEVADRALAWYNTRPADERTSGYQRYDYAVALYLRERWEDSRIVFEELSRQGPAHINVQGFLGVLAARRGDAETALGISERLAGMPPPGDFGRDFYWQGCIAAQLGEHERATTLLSEAYARGRIFSVYLHRDIDLEPLRDYPPFQEFMRPKG